MKVWETSPERLSREVWINLWKLLVYKRQDEGAWAILLGGSKIDYGYCFGILERLPNFLDHDYYLQLVRNDHNDRSN